MNELKKEIYYKGKIEFFGVKIIKQLKKHNNKSTVEKKTNFNCSFGIL